MSTGKLYEKLMELEMRLAKVEMIQNVETTRLYMMNIMTPDDIRNLKEESACDTCTKQEHTIKPSVKV